MQDFQKQREEIERLRALLTQHNIAFDSKPSKSFKLCTVSNYYVMSIITFTISVCSQMKWKKQQVWRLRISTWGETPAFLSCTEISSESFMWKHPTEFWRSIWATKRETHHWTTLLSLVTALKAHLNKWHQEKTNFLLYFRRPLHMLHILNMKHNGHELKWQQMHVSMLEQVYKTEKWLFKNC